MDAFGTRVIERLLQKNSALLQYADLADAHTDLLSRIDCFPAYERVVLIDAILDPDAKIGDAGHIVLLDEEALSLWPEASPSVHQLSPLLVVKLFRQLHPEATTRILLVGLCADRIELGSGMGAQAGVPPSEESVAAGARKVHELL
jgi:hydrogenase maturation protease